MAGGKLSLSDLDGADVISKPVTIDDMIAEGGGKKKGPRLSAADLEGAEVVSAPSANMGPEARRARGGGSPSRPRELTSEEAGTMAGPIKTEGGLVGSTGMRFGARAEQSPEMAALSPGEEVRIMERFPGRGSGVLGQFGQPKTLHVGPATGEMTDPLVQMGTAAALGIGAGAPLRAIPGIGGVLGSAMEGGTANKSLGGDFTSGALLSGIPAAIAPAARVIGGRNVVKEINKGITKAPIKLRNDVKFTAGDGGADLTEVLGELPAARKAVTTQARTNPGGASATLTDVIEPLTDANSAAFAAIQRQHGGVPLRPIVDKLEAMERRLNLQKRGVEADAVGRARADLLKPKRHDLPGAELTPQQIDELKISAQGIRNIRNDLGDVIDPARTIKANTKRKAQARIYSVLNQEIDDVAANTSGVNLAEFKARNRQISTLIPVRDALAARAESEGERTLMQKAKALPGKAASRTAREIGYRLGGVPAPPVGAVAEAATVPARDRRTEVPEETPRRRRPGDQLASEP